MQEQEQKQQHVYSSGVDGFKEIQKYSSANNDHSEAGIEEIRMAAAYPDYIYYYMPLAAGRGNYFARLWLIAYPPPWDYHPQFGNTSLNIGNFVLIIVISYFFAGFLYVILFAFILKDPLSNSIMISAPVIFASALYAYSLITTRIRHVDGYTRDEVISATKAWDEGHKIYVDRKKGDNYGINAANKQASAQNNIRLLIQNAFNEHSIDTTDHTPFGATTPTSRQSADDGLTYRT